MVLTRSRPARFAAQSAASAAAIASLSGTGRPTPTETVTFRPGAICPQGAARTAAWNRSATSLAAAPPPNYEDDELVPAIAHGYVVGPALGARSTYPSRRPGS